jgi:serine/threonine protein kinase
MELIGQGGMSVVYRAKDRQLKRNVAVKILHDFLAGQQDARRRFQREAVAVAQLKHRGIVEIFDYSGAESEDAYIVTELIEGPTLRAFVDDLGQLANPEIASLLTIKLAEALLHAHEHGVIHRDLKPENVMVSPEGELKLMDFGIAQIDGGPRLTLTGTLLGSPAHMAPEIIDGQRSDERADIFSLGTMLYWLATGKLPFEANNPSALFNRILNGEYDDPQMVEPKIGNGLAKIISKMLAPNRDDRFSNVAELIDALKADLAPLQLEIPDVAVREFLTHPEAYGEKLTKDLVLRLSELGQKAAKEKHMGHAMDCFNRVLALAPQNEDVHAAMNRILRAKSWTRRLKQLVIAAATLGVALSVGYGFAQLRSKQEQATLNRKAQETIPEPTKIPANPARATEVDSSSPKPSAKIVKPKRTLAKKRIGKAKTRLRRQSKAKLTPSKTPIPSKLAATPAEAEIELKIGNSFADVYIDNVVVRQDFMRGKIKLKTGRHKLQVVKPGLGAYTARIIQVTKDGQVFELGADGEQRLIAGALLFSIPKNDGSPLPPAWISQPKTQ